MEGEAAILDDPRLSLAAEIDSHAPRKRGRKPRLPRVTERAIQIAIKNRLVFHGIVCVHVPNSGKRTEAGGRRLKAEGMMPGFPDLILLRAGGLVGFMEVKALDGSLQPNQRDCAAMLTRMGQLYAVVRSQDEALAAVRAWGWIR